MSISGRVGVYRTKQFIRHLVRSSFQGTTFRSWPLGNRMFRRGFTIVELLIVIVVIGILAAITIVTYNSIQLRARTAIVSSDLTALKKAMLMYREEHPALPPGVDFYSGPVMPPTSNWASVVAALKAAGNISTSGLEKDPWGQYYWYDNNDCRIGQGGSSPLKSVGPDGLLGTADDIGILIITNDC